MNTVILGSGSFVPESIRPNSHFEGHSFFEASGQPIDRDQKETIQRFKQVTGIEERKHACQHITAADMAAWAGHQAIMDAGIDAETLDQVIVAHNFGDSPAGLRHPDMVPSLASRVKHKLGIKNTACVAYDLLFGCPGWLQGLIQADAFIRSGMAKTCLVIGTDVLSRNSDPHDRDSMIYSDGAGAIVVQAQDLGNEGKGMLGAKSASYANEDVGFIYMGKSNHPDHDTNARYLKMHGRKVYEFAVKEVPQAMKSCIDGCGVAIEEVKKIFIHQANEKMDHAIVERLYKLYGHDSMPAGVLPMNIQLFGNSSVATVPTLYDMVCKGKLQGHELHEGDVIVFASVGAGMNINAACYRV